MNAQSFGKYQLLKKIATGGMAEVWLARQTGIEGFQRNMVVKRILPHLADDPEFVQMFLNEAKIVAKFSHPNIAQIYELGEEDGAYFLAMEFIHGEDLGRLMRKAWSTGQWIARPLAIRIVANCCEGLYYAHSRTDESGRPLKVVHRDVSPQNILISFDGSVKLVDFGIAKAADQRSLTKSGAIKGKFAYMSPEQAAAKTLDNRSDIFAVGLVLYELLTGVRPLKRDSEIATLQAALECAIEPPSHVADVPAELDDVVMRALAKHADDRYRDARQFQLALEELLVSQRWVASSVQISELMTTLFAERLEEEKRLGHVEPGGPDPSGSGPAVAKGPAASGKGAQARDKKGAEMSWHAPPGTQELPRSSSRIGPRTQSRGTHTQNAKPLPVPDVPPWDAPPSAELPAPRRRTSTGTAVGRSTSKPEVERPPPAEPPRRQTVTRTAPPEPSEELPRRPSKSAVRRATSSNEAKPDIGELEKLLEAAAAEPEPAPVDPAPPPREEPRRKKKEKRRSGAVPDARPREVSPEAQAAERDAYLDLELLRVKSRQRLRWVLRGSITLGGALLLLLFNKPILDTLSSVPSTGQDVYVSVDSNIPVWVSVKHHKDERSREAATPLGRAPGLNRVAGAHLRDTIVLDNPELGAHYEEEIAFGQPGEVKTIYREFKTGHVKLDLKPASLQGASIFMNGRLMGQASLRTELVEGRHKLELRGDALKAPVELEVDVKAGQTTNVVRNLADKVER